MELGIRAFVTCGYFEGQTPGLHLFSPELREILADSSKTEYHFYPAFALGRALNSCMDEIPYSHSEGPCFFLTRMQITPGGDYIACSCLALNALPGGAKTLWLGNALDHTESEMRQAFFQNPLCLALAVIGPAELYRRLARPSSPPDFRCLCHACIALCSLPDVIKRVEEMLHRENLWPYLARKFQELYKVPPEETAARPYAHPGILKRAAHYVGRRLHSGRYSP